MILTMSVARAAPATSVPEKWHTPYGLYLTPREAYEMKLADPAGTLLIDVRTRAEVKFIGLAAEVDANIPIRTLDPEYRWSKKKNTFRTKHNPDFVAAVERLLAARALDREAPIILMCKSGSRAPIAARELHQAGFAKVYTQYQGFEGRKAKQGPAKGQRVVDGWRNEGLPWSYDLTPEQMYFTWSGE
jgi:rhodanese-related sulfurtransferase